MYADPLVPITPDRQKTASWPKYPRPRLIEYMPLSRALTIEHPTDAHAGAYSVPGVPHRLCTDPPAYERVEGGVPMVLFHWDIDCDASHKAAGGDARVAAGDAWWEATRPRIEEMLEAHPGGFVFRTRGGAHIIYRLPVPLIITDGASEIDWKRRYLASLASLARRFKLVCDPSVNDWPRLMRLPHVMRDGVMQRLETMGDAFEVAPFVYEPTHADELADINTVRALGSKWSPTLRILARNAVAPSRVARAPRVVEPRAVDVGALGALAVDLGRALRRHHGRHLVHLALAGACYARGIALDHGPELARAICAASGETDDRPQVWQTTADRARSGQPVTGYGHLAQHWPDLAALVDAALPSGGGARAARDELDARGRFVEVPADEASTLVRDALTSARAGLSVVRITEGAGKTRAAATVLRERAEACADMERIPSARKSVYVAPTHAVALEVAEILRGTRSEYRRSVLAVRDAGGDPACHYHRQLLPVVQARHSVGTWCEGKGMGRNGSDSPCPHLDGCAARAGTTVPLDESGRAPAVVVTVHALLADALAWAGPDALVILDEDPQAVEAAALTRAELDAAAGAEELFAHTERWRSPVLRAIAAGLERGELPDGAAQLAEVFARGCTALAGDAAWTADVAAYYPDPDPAVMLTTYAIRAAWHEVKKPDAPKKWVRRAAWAPRPNPRERSRVFTGHPSERFTTTSATHATVARLVAGVLRAAPEDVTPHAERAVAAVEVSAADATRRVLRAVVASPAVAAALHRWGPTVLLDATADLSMLGAIAGGAVPASDIRVADGAPVTRRLLFWSGASRKGSLDGAGARWDGGLHRYLRSALANVLDAGARRIGLFTWKALADALRTPGDDRTAAELMAWVRARGAELVVGHYGYTRGRNDWAGCDALVSIGDPRPNVGATRAIAAVLGLAHDHADVYRRATAAEVSQVAGRLRAPWRSTGAVHVHVGTIAPSSWDSRAEVMELPKGAAEGVDAGAVVEAVRVYGSQRAGAAAAGVSRRSVATHAPRNRVTEATVSHPTSRGVTSLETLAREQSPAAQSNTSKNISTAAPCTVGDTLKPQRFSVPVTPVAPPAAVVDRRSEQRELVERAGGAPAAARILGVSRATAYHWASGERPMPHEAAQRLRDALSPTQADEAPPRPRVVRFEVPTIEGEPC